MENFNNINLPIEVLTALDVMKITSPTEIQKKTIPIILEGSDILASSQTGSGKTFAYLLPIILSLLNVKGKALVLVPTRELATQVQHNFKKLTTQMGMKSVVLIGGENIGKQFSELRSLPNLIIGTPGRIIDHISRGTLKIQDVNVVVLDEMDRMLDMGMKEQLDEINKSLPVKRQVLMFSATMPQYIIELSQKYLTEPKRIMVGSTTKAALQIKQETLRVSNNDKFEELTKQLDQREGSIIVFVKTKKGADKLAKMLKFKDYLVEAIHGDLNQSKRDRVIASFRKSRFRIIVATDVMARGIDVDHVMHVINYDLPMCPEDYLHRVGRTGRSGAEGFALSFISEEDAFKWRAIDRLINQGESSNGRQGFTQEKRQGRSFSPKSRPGSGFATRGGPKRDFRPASRKRA